MSDQAFCPITLAFAGDGEVTLENTKALLNDFLELGPEDEQGFIGPSDREIRLVFPATTKHLSKTLDTILDWSGYADLPYTVVTVTGTTPGEDELGRVVEEADEIIFSDDVPVGIIDQLQQGRVTGEAYLVLAWGEGSPEAEELLDLATEAGIKAIDLTAGLDDISFRDEDEPEPIPEPEEKPKPAKRAATKTAEKEMVPVEKELTEDAPPKDIASRIIEETKAARETATPVVTDNLRDRTTTYSNATTMNLGYDVTTYPYDTVVVDPLEDFARRRINDLKREIEILESYLAQRSAETVAAVLEEAAASPTVKKSRGRPRKDGSPAVAVAEQPVAYLKWPDGRFTLRGEGRPPKDTTTVMLTPEEVVTYRAAGVIED